ncbi:hypothetical protein FB476_2599 [Ornithinimicrobium humiphilum]|uniref:MFS transporter n=1 Tax=Ornithinimicrobium humiphilum TaxID=125288 RepID=A0A543KRH7_9MICO|nr:hypothetical protein FB476_2599 [Ornithinimicrobium humiphilum]
MVGPGSGVGLEPQQFPLLLAVLAVGAVTGAVVAEPLVRRIPEVPLLVGCWAVNSGLLLVPVLLPTAPAIGAAFLVVGLTNMVGNVVGRTLRQRLVPTDRLGRVGGASGMIGYGLMPLGALTGRVVGEIWGLPVAFVGAAAVSLATVGYVATAASTTLVRAHEIA